MNYCPHCGSKISDPSLKLCGSCGKLIIVTLPVQKEIPVPQPVNQVTPVDKKKPVTNKFALAVGIGALIIMLVINNFFPQGSSNDKTNPSPQSNRSNKTPSSILSTNFYKKIGYSSDDLLKTLGKPTQITNLNSFDDLYIYDERQVRHMYSFKNSSVHTATYLLVNISPGELIRNNDALMSDLEQHSFWRISDYDNVKRYSNGTYDISIMIINNSDGAYNVGLMAGFKQ